MRIYVVLKSSSLLTDDNIFLSEEDAYKCASQLGREYKVHSYLVNESYEANEKFLWRVSIYNNGNNKVDKVIGKPEKELVRYFDTDNESYMFLIPSYTYDEALNKALAYYKGIESKPEKYNFLKEKLISKKTDFYHKGLPYKCPTYELGTNNILLRKDEYINYAVLTKEQSNIVSKFNIIYLG